MWPRVTVETPRRRRVARRVSMRRPLSGPLGPQQIIAAAVIGQIPFSARRRSGSTRRLQRRQRRSGCLLALPSPGARIPAGTLRLGPSALRPYGRSLRAHRVSRWRPFCSPTVCAAPFARYRPARRLYFSGFFSPYITVAPSRRDAADLAVPSPRSISFNVLSRTCRCTSGR